MKKLLLILVLAVLFAFPADVYAGDPSTHRFMVNGSETIVRAHLDGGHNYVQARELAALFEAAVPDTYEAVRVVDFAAMFGIHIAFDENTQTVILDDRLPFEGVTVFRTMHVPRLEFAYPVPQHAPMRWMGTLAALDGRVYTDTGFRFVHGNITPYVGGFLGHATHLTLPDIYTDAASDGGLYALRGYDPAFRVVFMMPALLDEDIYFPVILENLNNITVTTGADIFGGRFRLSEHAYAASVLSISTADGEITADSIPLPLNEAAQIIADLYAMPLHKQTFLPREALAEAGAYDPYWHQYVSVSFITRVPGTDFTVTTGVDIFRNGTVAFDSAQLFLSEDTAVAGWLSPDGDAMRLLAARRVWNTRAAVLIVPPRRCAASLQGRGIG